jgi:serine protease inhibitor
MHTQEPSTLQDSLHPGEILDANSLTDSWLITRETVPAAASGLGIWALLAVLASGADGDTREDLLDATGLEIEQTSLVPTALLHAMRSTPALDLAYAVWAGARVTLDPAWVAGQPSQVIGSLTGDAAADQAALDAWAAANTAGLIGRMPIDLTRPVDLVLASAFALRTKWITPFTERHAPFATGPWTDPNRHRVLEADYREDVLRVSDDATVLTVRGDDDIDVLLGLGREDLSPQEVMESLIAAAETTAWDRLDPAADLTTWGRSATELAPGEQAVGVRIVEYRTDTPQTTPEVRAYAPEFRVAAELDLRDDADALGLTRAMKGGNLSRLAAEPLIVNQARQSCTAAFSATGFEAAAVTAFGLEWMGFEEPAPQTHRHRCAQVTFDRPFAYLAVHRPTGLILVAGWIDDPTRELASAS